MAFVAGFTSGVKSFVGGHVSQRSVVARTSSTVRMSASGMSKSVPFLKVPKNTVGLIGSVEFDPLGLSDTINIKFLQEAELKHGRICMLAALGFIVQELYTFGGPYFPKMAPVDAHGEHLENCLDLATTNILTNRYSFVPFSVLLEDWRHEPALALYRCV